MTHADLVLRASKWLQSQGCAVVVTELTSSGSEIPDAIGWRGEFTTLIECKASRGDFRADSKKIVRRVTPLGLGYSRYYLTPPGLLQPSEVPEGWGLLEAHPQFLRVIRRSRPFPDRNLRSEILILLSCIRRIGQTAPEGVSVKFYTYKTKNTATLGVLEDGEI